MLGWFADAPDPDAGLLGFPFGTPAVSDNLTQGLEGGGADEFLRRLRHDDLHLRAALATPVLGLTLTDLDHLQQNELAWEERVEQFSHYHRLLLSI